MWNSIKTWYKRRYKEPFTVACDLSLFGYPGNEREQIFHATGLAHARGIARQWVFYHPSGQARIIAGHFKWEDDKTVILI